VRLHASRSSIDELARELDGTAQQPPSAQTAQAVRLVEHLTVAHSELEQASSPRPEFRDALRMRLLAVAAVQPSVPEPAPVRRPVRDLRARRVALLAGGLASVVTVSGVAVATSRSLPGDPLYAAKRVSEQVQLRVPGDAADKGRRHLELATTRLHEVAGLVHGPGHLSTGAPQSGTFLAAGGSLEPAMVQTLEDMDEQVRAGAALLVQQWREDHEDAPMLLVKNWSETQSRELSALVPELPDSAAERAQASLALLDQVHDQAVRLLAQDRDRQRTARQPAPSSTRPSAPSAGTPSGPLGTPGATPTPAPSSSTGDKPGSGTRPKPTRTTAPPVVGPLPSLPIDPGPLPTLPPPATDKQLPVPLPSVTLTLPPVVGDLGESLPGG